MKALLQCKLFIFKFLTFKFLDNRIAIIELLRDEKLKQYQKQ